MARPSSGAPEFESHLNAFVSIPYSKMAESSLRRENVVFQVEGPHIVVTGNEAPRFADLMNLDTRRPMTQGVLNPEEPQSLPVVRGIVQSLLHKAGDNPKICCTVPSAPPNHGESLTYHEASLRQMFSELGYELRTINEGLAVIFSELEDTNYTGIGISFGGGLCNVCLAYLSMPALSFSIPKAGDFIDSSAASVTGDLANRIRLEKEHSFYFNGQFSSKLQQVLSVYYDDMINSLIQSMIDVFSNSRKMPKLNKPVPIVLSGGTAAPKGFRERFQSLLPASGLPIQISEIRMARDPLHTTANGALVAALAEM
jgi:hypothetical protein